MDNSSSNVVAIVLATVGSVLLLTLALVGLYCYKKRQQPKTEDDDRMDSMIYNKNKMGAPTVEPVKSLDKVESMKYQGSSLIQNFDDDDSFSGNSANQKKDG